MAYTEKTTGRYIGQFTMFDPAEYNKLLNEGYSLEEARGKLKGTPLVALSTFYPFYSYTVNGVEYVRASYRLKEHFGRSAGSANMWMTGAECTVLYDPENPGDAIVEDKKGKAEAKDVVKGDPTKTTRKWIFVAIGIFAAFAIIRIIISIIFSFAR